MDTGSTAAEAPAPERFWNVPNALTLSRLVLSVAVFALIGRRQYIPALVVFGLASLTDAFDGYFARLLDQATAFGRQFDPLVDKVAVCGTFIYLLGVPGDTGLAPWMVATIVIRELLIQGLRSHLEAGGRAFGARFAGKIKMFAQMMAITAILFALEIPLAPNWLLARDAITWLAVALTVYSGLAYLAMAVPGLGRRAPSPLP